MTLLVSVERKRLGERELSLIAKGAKGGCERGQEASKGTLWVLEAVESRVALAASASTSKVQFIHR